MLCKWAKVWLLAGVLSGLCAPAQANTTRQDTAATASAVLTVANPLAVAQNAVVAAAAVPGALSARIAVLLPLRSDTLGRAAAALRAGFLAAYEHEKNGVAVTVIETGDSAQEILSAYTEAVAEHDVVVGPLSRSAVLALAQSGRVSKPTIALTQPESAGVVLPQQMLVMALSVEDEARQLANWAGAEQNQRRAFVISGTSAWQRRTAKAFVAQWQELGYEAQTIELSMSGGYLNAAGLAQLRTRMQNEQPSLLFAALDAEQTAQVRTAVGTEIAIYGTSQLNQTTLAQREPPERMAAMEGVRLLDLPWQLQADHTAVMVYPRQPLGADQKPNADLERLYALGIDAYRVAREIASHNRNFELDGVTGKLSVSFGAGASRFERVEQQAVYRDGAVVPIAVAK